MEVELSWLEGEVFDAGDNVILLQIDEESDDGDEDGEE